MKWFFFFLLLFTTTRLASALEVTGIAQSLLPDSIMELIHEGTNGLFEVRVQLGNNIFRVFCFFDGNRFVVLLTGFQKKTQKTPPAEIEKAVRLMNEYYKEKEASNG